MKQHFLSFLEKNKHYVIGGTVGLIIAILMLTINFWRTILLCFFTFGGCLVGMLFKPEGKEKLASLLDKIARKRK